MRDCIKGRSAAEEMDQVEAEHDEEEGEETESKFDHCWSLVLQKFTRRPQSSWLPVQSPIRAGIPKVVRMLSHCTGAPLQTPSSQGG